jgi:hypothetical protein
MYSSTVLWFEILVIPAAIQQEFDIIQRNSEKKLEQVAENLLLAMLFVVVFALPASKF